MDKLNFNRLIDAYLDGSANEADKALLEAYYEKLWAGPPQGLIKRQDDVLQETIYNNIISRVNISEQQKPKVELWPRIVAVAAAMAVITLGIWYYTAQHSGAWRDTGGVQYVNDIAPGKNMASLTFTDGKTITLSEAKTGVVMGDSLKYNDGTVIRNPSSVAQAGDRSLSSVEMTLSTPRGGMYQVTLSEGTKVWLNADSRLTYPSSLDKSAKRLVKLVGEAYFEVAKDKIRPFIVESAGQKVEVLGTHFNVNSYIDQGATITTLIEGSVRVLSSGNFQKSIVLRPQQQSMLSNEIFTVSESKLNATSWIKDKFSFYDSPLQDVMKQLARWYDVEVLYPNGVPVRKFTGDINRNVNLSEVLGLFKFSGVQFNIEGRKIIVNNNN